MGLKPVIYCFPGSNSTIRLSSLVAGDSETVSWARDIVHLGPLQLEWTTQNYSIHILQKMSSSSPSWHTIAMTPKSSLSLSNLDFCRDQLRISAVNVGGVGTVWKPILTNKLRLPAVQIVSENYSKGSSEVVVNLSWRAPESWEKVVDTYSVSALAHPQSARSFHHWDIIKEVNGTSTAIRVPLDRTDAAITLIVKTTVNCVESQSVPKLITLVKSGPQMAWYRLPAENLTISFFIESYPSSSHPGSYAAMVAWGDLTFSRMASLMLFWGEAVESRVVPRWYTFQQNAIRNITLPLNATSFIITSLKPESMYGVELVAAFPKGVKMPGRVFQRGRHTDKAFSTGEIKMPTTTPAARTRPTILIDNQGLFLRNHKLSIYIVVPVAVGLVLAFLTFCLVGIYRRHSNSSKASLSRDEESIPNIYSSPSYPALLSSCQVKPDVMDRWEISPARIKVGDVLGEGAFGQVLKGLVVGRIWSHQSSLSAIVPREAAHGEHTVVAVKMLHKYAEDTQKQEFLREIELMKELGYHPNVVSLIGCCTIQDPICLLVEHCYYGDLLHYLRNRRSEIFDQFKTGRAPRTPCKDTLRPLDLLSFARQIAMGMEYISQKGFVHRDLAARNVMVADDKNVKIGDFGLTRYVYDDKVYVNRRGGKLPVKWMSIEAIYDQVFTTKGDVWSYGVVLFEIMTLGAAPYPGIPNKDMPKLLKGGYRMEKPENCSPEIFSIMQSCWRDDPEAREGFTQLRNRLEEMMEQNVCYMEFDSDKQQCFYYSSSSSSSDEEDSIIEGVEVEAEESPMLESAKLEMMRDGHLATPMLKIPSGCANALQSRSTLNLSHVSPCKPSAVVSISLNSLDHSKQTELPWLPSDTVTFGRNIDNRAYYAGHLSTSDDAMAQNSAHIQGEDQSSENPYSGVIGSLEGVHGHSVPIFAQIQAGSLESREGSPEELPHSSGESSQDSDSCIGDENSSDEEHHHMIKDFVHGGDLFDSCDMSPDDVQCIQYPPLIALKHRDEGKELISPTSLDSGVSCDMATSKLMMDACMEVHPTSLADSTV
ncbi:uncharacterized protein [Diadema antillarum]|uniref:uncharacterized protein n=1 Tax=Diadema antillarum TaxID=105358 RepID=UPI003A8AD34D